MLLVTNAPPPSYKWTESILVTLKSLLRENLVEFGGIDGDKKGNPEPGGGEETKPSKGGSTSRALGCSSFLVAQRAGCVGTAPNPTSRRIGPRDSLCSSNADSSASAPNANDLKNAIGARTVKLSKPNPP